MIWLPNNITYAILGFCWCLNSRVTITPQVMSNRGRDRQDRRSCKIFASNVNFPRKQRLFLHDLQKRMKFTHFFKYTHLDFFWMVLALGEPIVLPVLLPASLQSPICWSGFSSSCSRHRFHSPALYLHCSFILNFSFATLPHRFHSPAAYSHCSFILNSSLATFD